MVTSYKRKIATSFLCSQDNMPFVKASPPYQPHKAWQQSQNWQQLGLNNSQFSKYVKINISKDLQVYKVFLNTLWMMLNAYL